MGKSIVSNASEQSNVTVAIFRRKRPEIVKVQGREGGRERAKIALSISFDVIKIRFGAKRSFFVKF